MENTLPTRLTIVLDCPEPAALAEFYRQVIGSSDEPDVDADGSWADVTWPLGRIAFQQIPDYVPPTWPGGAHPQMLHLDFKVDDLDAAHERVLGVGARLIDDTYDDSFRVYADPAGHPFCLTS